MCQTLPSFASLRALDMAVVVDLAIQEAAGTEARYRLKRGRRAKPLK
jgi:hypothetical protein